jgi:hypothetical protein
VGGRRGREIRRRARVRTSRSTAGAGRADLTGRVHGAKREERDARGNGSATGEPGPRVLIVRDWDVSYFRSGVLVGRSLLNFSYNF